MSRSAGAERPVRTVIAAGPSVAAVIVMTVAAAIAIVAVAAGVAIAADPAPETGVPAVVDPPTNPSTPAKVALGAKLFADPRLAADDRHACATCHVAEIAFTDGNSRARGLGGKELGRNSPSLLNVGTLQRLFWDGRAASLEEQARMPILNPDEMAMTDEATVTKKIGAIAEYPPLFEKAFGDRTITLQRIARALAAFQRTLVAGDSPFDRWWRGDAAAMDESAQRGYRVFVDRGGCSQCHSIRQSYATFTDNDFHNTGAGKGDGLTDRGRAAISNRPEDEGAFRTPSLRNVALTKPYMHDGSLGSLDEVVDFYVQGGRPNPHLSALIRPLDLDERDRADLVAFMKALTSIKLPTLDACDALLAEGRPRDAFEAFRLEFDERQGGDRALLGMARAAVTLAESAPLLDVERRLRRRLAEASPERSKDASPIVADLLLALAQTNVALTPLDESGAGAREDDALIALRRIRTAGGLRDDAAELEATLLERSGRAEEAVALLRDATTPTLRIQRAKIRYRRGWSAFTAGKPTDPDRADLVAAADEFDALAATDAPLDVESRLLRATARHWLGDVGRARAAYLEAAAFEDGADKALRGLRNLLAKDLPRFRADLATVLSQRPDSPAVLYLAGWEAVQEGRDDDAEALLRRRLEVETTPSAGPHVLLARIERKRSRRAASLAHYAVALGLDPRTTGLVAEYEGYVRERALTGFDDVDALVAEYRTLLDAGPDDARFQIVTRNNVAFILRDVAASYTSRGPARLHVFVEGAPPKAREVLRSAVRFYEESAALVPEDAADLPFAERWIYAGVFNDLGLMLHYFPEIQDLPRAESLYLRAFELTDGAYQDAYFYNLQFLYGFEVTGRDAKWLDLAERAKDAILKEDPSSPTGFSPDTMKRAAARRDYERLSAKLRR